MITGLNILITGGSSGIGLVLTRKLLQAGAGRIWITCQDADSGEKAVTALKKELNSDAVENKVFPILLELRDDGSISGLVQRIQEVDQQLHVLVNNAAVFPEDWRQESYDACLRTNCQGPLRLTCALKPHMAPGGAIVMVSSWYGKLEFLSPDYRERVSGATTLEALWERCASWDEGSPMAVDRVPAYKISKAMINRGVQLLSQADFLNSRRLVVNAVCPGWCRTKMGGPDATRSAEQGADSILWVINHCTSSKNRSGGFYQDGEAMSW